MLQMHIQVQYFVTWIKDRNKGEFSEWELLHYQLLEMCIRVRRDSKGRQTHAHSLWHGQIKLLHLLNTSFAGKFTKAKLQRKDFYKVIKYPSQRGSSMNPKVQNWASTSFMHAASLSVDTPAEFWLLVMASKHTSSNFAD